MATITSPGVGSGLDVTGIVSKLMDIERQPVAALDKKEVTQQAKVTAFGTLKSGLATLQTAAAALSDPFQFLKTSATSSNTDAFTASSFSNATQGTHAIEVTQTAQAQRIATGTFASTDAVIGTGNLTIQFGQISGTADSNGYFSGSTFAAGGGSAPVTVKIDGTNNSLSGVRDAINSANAGVTASILNDGTGYRLVIASNTAGANNALKITTSGDSDGNNTDKLGLSQLAYDPTATKDAGQNLSQVSAAQSAKLKIDGINITSQTNSVADAIPGVTLTIKAPTTSPATLSVNQDMSGAATAITTMVKAYNDLNKSMSDLTAYDPTTKTAAALQGESVVRSIQFELRNTLSGALPSGSFTHLSQVGITFGKDGSLSFDASKFNTAAASNASAVAGLFGQYGASSDPQVKYVSASKSTKVGNYGISINQIATQGSVTADNVGTLGSTGFFTVDDTNKSYTVDLGGGVTSTFDLDPGRYNNDATLTASLADQIQSKLYDDPQFAVSDIAVAYNATKNTYDITVDSNPPVSLALNRSTNTDTLLLNVDGKSANPVTVTAADYELTPTAFASALQSRINADPVLKGAGSGVSVAYDAASQKYTFNSNLYGANSNVNITSVSDNLADISGLAAKTGTAGLDVQGSIGNAAGLGSGQYLTGQGPAQDLKLQITGGAYDTSLGAVRGSVSYNRGFAYQLNALVDGMIGKDGTLTSRTDGINTTIKDIDKQRDTLNTRLSDTQTRLLKQYNTLDSTISKLQSTSTYLTQQLASLSASTKSA